MTIVDRLMHWLYSIETSHQEFTCINIQNPVVSVLLSTRTHGLCMESHWALQHWYSIGCSQSWQSHWESWIHVQVGMGQTPNLTLLFTPYLAALDVHSPIPMVLYALTHPEACLFSLVPAAYQGNVWKSFFQDLRTWEKEDTERFLDSCRCRFFAVRLPRSTRCPWFVLWQPRGCWLPRHHWLAALLQHAQIKTNSNSFRRSLLGEKMPSANSSNSMTQHDSTKPSIVAFPTQQCWKAMESLS